MLWCVRLPLGVHTMERCCSCLTQRALVINSLLVSFGPQWCVLCFVWTVWVRATVFGFSGTRRLQQIVNILDRKQVTHIILNWKYVTTLSANSPTKGLILKSRDTTSTWTGSYIIHYVLCNPLWFFTGVFYNIWGQCCFDLCHTDWSAQ